MQSRLVTLCIILTLVVMLPVVACADAQEEFELSCMLKTANASAVYDGKWSEESEMGNVFTSIPAGTYVKVHGTFRDTWKDITFCQNGVKMRGWAEVRTVAATSSVRNSGGMLDSVHEKDPDYDAKMQQGTVEVDIREGWTIYENDPFTEDLEHITPEEAAARAGQYGKTGSTTSKSGQKTATTSSATTTGATTTKSGTTSKSTATVRTSTKSTAVTLRAKLRRVSGKEAPEDLLTAFVYAPSSGRASLREAADNSSKVLAQCTAGTVVTVLEIGKTHSKVDVDGQVGYLRNDCLGYSAVKEGQVLTGILVGGSNINVRGGADKDSYRIGQWPSGTQVTVYGVHGNWCEVEFNGVHGWVATKYVVPVQ